MRSSIGYIQAELEIDRHSGYSDTQTVGLQGLSIRQPRSSTEGAGARTTVALGARLAGAPEAITSEAIETAEGGDMTPIRPARDGFDLPAMRDEAHSLKLSPTHDVVGVPQRPSSSRTAVVDELLFEAAPIGRTSRCPSEATLLMVIGGDA